MIPWEFIAEVTEPLWPGLLAAAIFILGVILIRVLPKYKWAAAAILLIIITPVALPGFWFSSGHLGISDWDLYFSYYHALRRSLVDFHQFPLWNPWICGGSAALGDPEFPVFSPLFASILAFGVESGFKLNIYIVTAVGACGSLMLGKRLGLSVYAALLAALGVAFSTVNLLEVVEGHPNIFAAMWIPWIFWSWHLAYSHQSTKNQEPRTKQTSSSKLKIWNLFGPWILDLGSYKPMLLGLLLALAFFQGGVYLLSYTVLAFLVLIFLAKNHLRAFQVALFSGLWALGFAAVKLVPTALWLSQFQDESYASSTYTLPYLHKILFGRYLHGAGSPGEIIPHQGSGWHEYGAYIGPFVASLAVIGLARFRRSRAVQALAIAALLALLLSSAGPILKPVFDQVSFIPRSNVSRIILFAVIPLSLLAGYGFDLLLQKTSHKLTAAAFAIVLLAYVSADLFTLTAQLSAQAFVLPSPEILPPAAPAPIAHITDKYEFRHRGVDYTRAYAAARLGYGTNAECNVLRPKQSTRTIHDKENFGPVLEKENLIVLNTQWSPSKITTRARALRPPLATPWAAEVQLNTNYAKGWWVTFAGDDTPQLAQNLEGRVGMFVPLGEHTLTFVYRPRGRWTGLAITAATTAAAAGWVFYTRRRDRSLPPRP